MLCVHGGRDILLCKVLGEPYGVWTGRHDFDFIVCMFACFDLMWLNTPMQCLHVWTCWLGCKVYMKTQCKRRLTGRWW